MDDRKSNKFTVVGFGIFHMGRGQWDFCQHARMRLWLSEEKAHIISLQSP